MSTGTVLCIKGNEAIRYAAAHLASLGIPVTVKCAPDISHVLLSVPSFTTGDEYLAHLLGDLPDDVIICGGNLTSPLLEGYHYIDFLRDPDYLAANAAITAHCALQILENQMGKLSGKEVLVVGWGRIGKCLMRLLEQQGAYVTVAARNPADLAMIRVLGAFAVSIDQATDGMDRFDAVVNTVPVLLYPNIPARSDAVLLELASKAGMTGENIIDARGLPSKMAPSKSGKLIAETFVRLTTI